MVSTRDIGDLQGLSSLPYNMFALQTNLLTDVIFDK